MILSENQILQAANSEHQDYAKNVKYEEILDIFINGNNHVSKLLQISNLENEKQIQLRKKYTKSTKYLAENVLRPIDKVFSARGGFFSVSFKNDSDNLQKDFALKLDKVANGVSLSYFFENIWKKKYVDSPRSIFLIETDDTGKAYPVFIKAKYLKNWRKKDMYSFDFVVIDYDNCEVETEKIAGLFPAIPKDYRINSPKSEKIEVYRVIDDAYDYTVLKYDEKNVRILKPNEKITISGKEYTTYANIFGEVPATQISDIINNDLINKDSIVDSVIELFNESLLDDSLLRIYKFLHGYPYFWEVEDDCQACGGTGFDGENVCPVCGGTGLYRKKDVSDAKLIRKPETGDTNILPNIAGYIQPALETWTKMSEDIEKNQKLIHYTIWGTYIQEDSRYQTATGRLIDSQPVNDRLVSITNTYNRIEKWIIDRLGYFYYKDNYVDCVVLHGTEYLLETANEIFEKYEKAKTAGIGETELNDLLLRYYATIYKNNPSKLETSKKDLFFEPYKHLSIYDVESLGISESMKNRKRYYHEYRKTLSTPDFLSMKLDDFNAKLDAYINDINTKSVGA